MNDPVTIGLVILVTVVTTAVLVLIGWVAKRLLELLFGGWRPQLTTLSPALAEQHRWLKLIGVYGSADRTPPLLQQVDVTLREAAEGGEEGPRLAWSEIFQPGEKRLVILGSPGAGKSTLLDYLVLAFTGRLPHDLHPLRVRLGPLSPLFARLRDLGSEGAGSLQALLAQAGSLKPPAKFPERLLRGGGCLVLLDGLDEVLAEERQAWAVEEIERLAAEYPDNYYVITCRLSAWRSQLPGFRTYEIQPFTRDDVRRLTGGWYSEVLRAQEPEGLAEPAAQPQELWQTLAARADLLPVASTPLLLSLITLMFFHRQTDFPKGRAKLYERCVEILVDLWDRQDQQLRLPEKRMVLGAVAFHLLKAGRLEEDVPALRGVVEPLLPGIAAPVTAEGLVRQIGERSGLFQEQRPGWLGFSHRTLQDFFAAAYVVEHELGDLLVEHAGDEPWREVILMAAGLAPAGLAQRLADLMPAEDVQLGADARAEIRRRLLDRLSRDEAAGPFRRLAEALRATDPEGARGWMETELRGSDPSRLRRVLELVPDLGEEHVRPLSASILRLAGESADRGVRLRALRSLGGLKVPFDADVRQVLEKARQAQEPAVKSAASWAWCELGRPEDLGLVKVPAGEFLMGSAEEFAPVPAKPQHLLYLADFYLGRDPVTVGGFSAFLAASGYKLKEKEGRFRAKNLHADHPARVSWIDAAEYARWRGMSLPSEAEWEKAARGTDGRRYPWGNEWKPGHANTLENWPSPRKATTTPVGAFSPQGDSPYGCRDMVGNVWEWTRCLNGHYPYDPADGREDFRVSLKGWQMLRGGSPDEDSRYFGCAFRLSDDFRTPARYTGFRVVLVPRLMEMPS